MPADAFSVTQIRCGVRKGELKKDYRDFEGGQGGKGNLIRMCADFSVSKVKEGKRKSQKKGTVERLEGACAKKELPANEPVRLAGRESGGRRNWKTDFHRGEQDNPKGRKQALFWARGNWKREGKGQNL